MAKTAGEYLDELARQELVPPHIVASLRLQVGQSIKPISAATIARLLVEKKHLTAAQAERLLGAPLSSTSRSPVPASAASQAPSPLAETKPMEPEELGLAPLEDRRPLGEKAPPPKQAAQEHDEPLDLELLDLVPLDDLPATAPSKPAATRPAAAKRPPATAIRPAVGRQPQPASGAAAAGLTPLTPPPLDSLQPLEALAPLDALVPLERAPSAAPATAPSPRLTPSPAAAGAGAQVPTARQPAAVQPSMSAAQPTTGLMTVASARPVAPPARSRTIWLVAGISALIVFFLAIGGAAAFVLLPRGTENKEFELAQQEYQAKRYAAAAEQYSKLLKSYPRHRHAGLARVRGGMARILAAQGTGEDWPAVLPVAREVLAIIEREPELAQVHDELAPLLTDMAVGLLKRAQEATSAGASAAIKDARAALALADNGRYVPGSMRDWQRLAEAEDGLALLERRHSAQLALEQSLGAAQEALKGRDLGKVNAVCEKLLANYPELAGDAKFVGLLRESGQVAAACVQPVSKLDKAQAAERSTPVIGSLSLVHAPVAAAPGPAGTFLAQAGGSVWGLDAATGKVLWRRHIGNGARFAPVPLSADDRSKVLFVDGRYDEVQCIDRQTGAPAWRHALDADVVGPPVVIGQRVFVTSRDGRVTALDSQSGDAAFAAQLTSSAGTGAVASFDGQRLYQLADRHFLYALAADDLKCQGSIFLGHDSGCVVTPPLLLDGRLVFGENREVDHSILHVVHLDTEGLPQKVVQVANLPGLILTPPLILPRRLLVLTDRATIALDVPADATEPSKQVTDTSTHTSLPLLRFGLPLGNRLCTADVGLRWFDVTPEGGLTNPAWTSFEQYSFEAAPQAIGDVILCVRRTPGRPGWIAAAVKSSDGGPLWETPLGVPIADISIPNDKMPSALTMLGGIGAIDLLMLRGDAVQEVTANATGAGGTAISASVPLSGGRRLLIPPGQPRELLLVDAADQPARSIPFLDALSGIPVAGAGGSLIPTSSGAVYWLDDDGTLAASPFQMRMAAGERLAHCSAVSVGNSGRQFVVADGRSTLYHLALETEPQPHLTALAVARLEVPPMAPIAALGERACIVDQSGNLRSFDLPDLKPGTSQPLTARAIVSGPHRVGEALYLVTDRQELVCIQADGSIRWKVPLKDGLLAGSPIGSAGNLIVATTGGTILRLAADSGKELSRLEINQPLAGSPVAIGNELLASTADGCVLKIALPLQEADPP